MNNFEKLLKSNPNNAVALVISAAAGSVSWPVGLLGLTLFGAIGVLRRYYGEQGVESTDDNFLNEIAIQFDESGAGGMSERVLKAERPSRDEPRVPRKGRRMRHGFR